MDAGLITSMLFATVVAGTPLIIVALGLLVSEKAGVLNLGAEGMMAMGAVAAFAVTHESGNPWLGVAAGMGAGMAMALLFGVLTLTLMANQVASGLALAIFGVGLAAFVGRLNAFGILLASLLMALLYIGGEQAQQYLNLPSSISMVFQGMLLFFLLGSDVFIHYRLRLRRRAATGH